MFDDILGKRPKEPQMKGMKGKVVKSRRSLSGVQDTSVGGVDSPEGMDPNKKPVNTGGVDSPEGMDPNKKPVNTNKARVVPSPPTPAADNEPDEPELELWCDDDDDCNDCGDDCNCDEGDCEDQCVGCLKDDNDIWSNFIAWLGGK